MQTPIQYKAAQLSAQTQAVLKNRASPPQYNENAMKAAKEFESVFLTNMLENMFTGIEAEEPFGGGHAERVYRSMQISEYAKEISRGGGVGIAEHVYRELIATQEGVIR